MKTDTALLQNVLRHSTENTPHAGVWAFGAMVAMLVVVWVAAKVSASRRTPHDDDLDIGL